MVDSDVPQDAYLLKMKMAKDVRAVSKVDFATFASAVSEDWKIFSYEGVADKFVYYHWIRSLCPSLKYEPYVCKNKAKVLQLSAILQDDVTGLGDRVYYFIDRDFDGLQGYRKSDRIFVTDRYSIENYVVCPDLLEDVLTIDFHCDGYPLARKCVKDFFENIYDQFLNATSSLNFRIFIARQLNIKQVEDLPSRINKIACIGLTNIIDGQLPAELVKLEREPTREELDRLEGEFQKLNPRCHYRGKFALLFFVKWLSLLRQDRVSSKSVFFDSLPPVELSIDGGFKLETLAPKSRPPEELENFLLAMA